MTNNSLLKFTIFFWISLIGIQCNTITPEATTSTTTTTTETTATTIISDAATSTTTTTETTATTIISDAATSTTTTTETIATTIISDTATSTTTITETTTTTIISDTATSTTTTSETATTATTISDAAITVTTTTPQSTQNIDIRLKFEISTSEPLLSGSFTSGSSFDSVQNFIQTLFANDEKIINVATSHIEIQSSNAKNLANYIMFTDNRFVTRDDCNKNCLDDSMKSLSANSPGSLSLSNGTQIAVQFSRPTIYETPTARRPYPPGESSPGKSARLGMGIGISFIAIIILVETGILYRTYGCSGLTRQENYGASAHYYQN